MGMKSMAMSKGGPSRSVEYAFYCTIAAENQILYDSERPKD